MFNIVFLSRFLEWMEKQQIEIEKMAIKALIL